MVRFGTNYDVLLHRVGLGDIGQIGAHHRVEVLLPQHILIGGNDDLLRAGEEHHADGDGNADPEPLLVPFTQGVLQRRVPAVVEHDAVVFRRRVDEHAAEADTVVELHQLLVNLLAAARHQQGAVRREATHRFVDEAGRDAERRHEGGTVEPFEQIDGVVEQADERERRMEDQATSDQRVGDGWIRAGGVEQDPGRADGTGRQDNLVGLDGDGNTGVMPRLDGSTTVLPYSVHGAVVCSRTPVARRPLSSKSISSTIASGMMPSGFSASAIAG